MESLHLIRRFPCLPWPADVSSFLSQLVSVCLSVQPSRRICHLLAWLQYTSELHGTDVFSLEPASFPLHTSPFFCPLCGDCARACDVQLLTEKDTRVLKMQPLSLASFYGGICNLRPGLNEATTQNAESLCQVESLRWQLSSFFLW